MADGTYPSSNYSICSFTYATDSSSCSSPTGGRNFPDSVIFGILSRLPVKSVLRFACVSEQWRTTVSLPSFISQHLARSPASLLIHGIRPPIPVAGGTKPGGYAIYSYHGPPNPESAEESTVSRILDFPGHDAVGFNQMEIIGSTPNGVFCIVQQPCARKFTLWNPATRSSLPIPNTATRPGPLFVAAASAGFGFDPFRNEYKLIRILHLVQETVAVPDLAEVFDFQTGRWARLLNDRNGTVGFRVQSGSCEAVVDGVPYWRAWDIDPVVGPRLVLAWFDAKRSDFTVEVFGWEAENRKMILGEIREGHLGAIVWDVGPAGDRVSGFDVWMRRVGAWVNMYRVDQVCPPVAARMDVVGLYALDGSCGIVQHIVVGADQNGNGKPYLRIINCSGDDDVAVDDYISLNGSWQVTFPLVFRYRESLAPMPWIPRPLNPIRRI